MADSPSRASEPARQRFKLCADAPNPKLFFERYRQLKLYEDEQLQDYGGQLLGRIHTTVGARFEAARRHKKKNRISVVSILVLSFYAMFFSMVSTFDKIADAKHKDILALLSVFMSSFIIAFSVYEASKRYDVRAENFLRSARLIQGIRDEFNAAFLSKALTWKECEKFEAQYFRVLDSYSDNHGHLDYLIFRANIGKLNRCHRWRIRVTSMLAVWWLFCFSSVSPLFVFGLYYVLITYLPRFLPL